MTGILTEWVIRFHFLYPDILKCPQRFPIFVFYMWHFRTAYLPRDTWNLCSQIWLIFFILKRGTPLHLTYSIPYSDIYGPGDKKLETLVLHPWVSLRFGGSASCAPNGQKALAPPWRESSAVLFRAKLSYWCCSPGRDSTAVSDYWTVLLKLELTAEPWEILG